ncbi:kinase-like domain-containing protein [Nemania sp. FL0031]|nr:kinase-like domain-containing protein [Nemania sp. FL0031]
MERSKNTEFSGKSMEVSGAGVSRSVHELTLQPNHVLPFTYVSKNRSEGAFSEVRQVTIHPHHMTIQNMAFRDQPVTLALKDIKEITPEDDNKAKTAEKGKREINAHISISKLRHPHIVKLVAAIVRGEKRYMLMEWADGGDLQQLWERNKSPRLSVTLVRDVVIQLRGLVGGLEALHNHEGGSYRHGDLKPENILRFKDGNKEETETGANVKLGILKIADMGLAKQHKVPTQLRQDSNPRYTTYRYEPPEIKFRKASNCGLSRRYDIWSLGCICVEFLIWVPYGSNGLNIFNKYSDGTSGEPFTYYAVNNTGKVVLHPRVESLLDEIVRNDPECKEQSAIWDLLAVIRTQMLVVDLGSGLALADAADLIVNETGRVI